MSANRILTKGHHTCKACQHAYALQHAPFKSCYKKRTNNEPFLGDGFYFWDDNLPLARWWGDVHYHNEYLVLEYDLDLGGDHFLDLVGSRQDLVDFKKLVEKVRLEIGRKDFGVYKCIKFLQETDRCNPGIFPIRIIRVMDANLIDFDDGMPFAENKKGYMLFDPCFIICFYDRKDVPLHTAKIVE